jgi:hypothetical protein
MKGSFISFEMKAIAFMKWDEKRNSAFTALLRGNKRFGI